MINYVIDQEKGETIAYISGCADDVVNRLAKVFGKDNLSEKVKKAAKLPDEFSAKVQCHPDDTWDEEEGKRQAKKKLLSEYHAKRVKALNRVDKVVCDMPFNMMLEIRKVLNVIKKYEEKK